MNKSLIAVGVIVLGGVIFYVKNSNSEGGTRVVVDEEIVKDPNFAKLPDFLTQFNDCLRSDKALTECEKMLIVDDEVFKGAEALRATMQPARDAMKQMASIEFLRPNGRVLLADTDRHEVPVYNIAAFAKYPNGNTRINYTVVIQQNDLKVNGYVIERGPQ